MLHSQAEIALSKGEVPVGCVVVHTLTERVVSYGHNETNKTFNVRVPFNTFTTIFCAVGAIGGGSAPKVGEAGGLL